MTRTVVYEQPLNERIRTFLRLEFLFQQLNHFLAGSTPWDSRAAISALIDIGSIFDRADLKTEVIRELERHAALLAPLEQVRGVDVGRLGEILGELDLAVDRMRALPGPVAQDIREDEFLTSIQQRSGIPGGTCDFDIPAFHAWLERPSAQRAEDLTRRAMGLNAVESAVGLILSLVRGSSSPTEETARGGFFQMSLDPNLPHQLVRVEVPDDCGHFAEISGGKHRFTVRFMATRWEERAAQTENDVDFVLTCCAI